ncbi:(2Fe-2S)-binding protein [Methylobacterium oxalidis]|uniref:(2Fe-2S)-binding protein n=1 Tax=Methylobacterium oxalidis TaxID=944322 RepID=UPI0011BE3EA3
MIICSCNVLSDGEVRACVRGSASCPRTPAQVYACLGCSPRCGRCAQTIRSILRKACDGIEQAHIDAPAMTPSLLGAGPVVTTVRA